MTYLLVPMVVDNQRKDTTKIKILISKLPFFLKCFSLRIEDYSMNTLNLNGSKEGTVRFVNVYDQKSSPGSRFLPPKWVWWLVFACPCVENWNLLPLRGKFAWHRSQGILAAHRIAHILLPNHQAPRSMTCPLGKKQKYRWQFQAKNYFFM